MSKKHPPQESRNVFAYVQRETALFLVVGDRDMSISDTFLFFLLRRRQIYFSIKKNKSDGDQTTSTGMNKLKPNDPDSILGEGQGATTSKKRNYPYKGLFPETECREPYRALLVPK